MNNLDTIYNDVRSNVEKKAAPYAVKAYWYANIVRNEFDIISNVYKAYYVYDEMKECNKCQVEPVAQNICDEHREQLYRDL